MVRPEDGIALADLYWYEVQQSLPGVYVRDGSVRSNDSRRILGHTYFRDEYVEPTAPDVLILQIGIVDCTPRIMRDFERRLVSVASQLPLLRRAAASFIASRSRRRYDLTRARPFTLVPLDEYDANINAFVDRVGAAFAGCWVIHVPIPCPNGPMVERNYGIVELVTRYNDAASRAVLSRGGATVDLFDFTRREPGALLSDGYHLAPTAHRYLARELGGLLGKRWASPVRVPARSAT